MDGCTSNIQHPDMIEIYQNSELRNTIPYEDNPMPFLEKVITVDGKQCITDNSCAKDC